MKKNLLQYQKYILILKGLLLESIELANRCTYSFVHMHLNLYSSTKSTLQQVISKCEKSCIILVEDYGLKLCEGVKCAVDEFCVVQNVSICYLTTGQAIVTVRG